MNRQPTKFSERKHQKYVNKELGCQVLIKSCCRHPFRPRNSDLCSMQKTWLEAKEIYENLPEKSFNHPYEACKKSDSNSKGRHSLEPPTPQYPNGSGTLQFWLDRTHSFRISPNPGTKSVKENATKQPAFANLETVFVRKQCCN
ncbi:hypothetical protein IGI04_042960, partial [Brassica rapa subsp. trilocularis]